MGEDPCSLGRRDFSAEKMDDSVEFMEGRGDKPKGFASNLLMCITNTPTFTQYINLLAVIVS